MNKGIAFFMIMLVLWMQPYAEKMSEEEPQQIPDEAIRLRILANSDAEKDQQLKRQVRDEVNTYINELVMDIADIEEARQTIRLSVPELEDIVEATINETGNKATTYKVEYRSNVSFPTKKYDQYIYPAGEYEAVLITLGKGEGANWWCVLFPPLCFLDFSNGTTVADTETTVGDEEINELDQTKEKEDMESDVFGEVENTNETEEVEIKFFLFDWLGLS